MFSRLLLTVLLITVHFTGIAQNGITKYPLAPGDIAPGGYFIHNNIMYFSAVADNRLTLDLWMMDGTAPKKIGKGTDQSPFPYHYIVGGKGDSLFLLVMDLGQSIYGAGLYAYDLKKDLLQAISLHSQIQAGGALLQDSSDVFYCAEIQNRKEIYRYDIPTGQLSVFGALGDTGVLNIQKANGYYYMACSYSVQGTGTKNIFLFDTVSKSLINPPLMPGKYDQTLHYPELKMIGTDVYFIGRDPQYGAEIYKHTATGQLQRVTDMKQGKNSSVSDYHMGVYNNRLYFSGVDKYPESLFEYDPATGQTKLIFSKRTTDNYKQFGPQHFYVYNNRLYMSGWEQPNLSKPDIHQVQPFVYDGADTPRSLAVVHIGKSGTQHIFPKMYTEYKGDLYFSSIDSFGERKMFRFNDSSLRPLKITEPKGVITATLYPNPTMRDAYLNVELDNAQTLNIQVLDMQGRMVYARQPKLYSTGGHKVMLPVSTLPAGTYIYRIADGENKLLQSGRLVKQ